MGVFDSDGLMGISLSPNRLDSFTMKENTTRVSLVKSQDMGSLPQLLLLSLVFPPHGVPKASTMGGLAAHLRGIGHPVTVFTTTPHYNHDPEALAAQPLTPWWGKLLLVARAVEIVARGDVLGWFQGRMEWGPRALGNRSIIADPRRDDMKDILNARIKHREKFRPFAPSVLQEAVGEYFDQTYPDPFMLKVYNVLPEKRAAIPAVTHVDGTGRLQTVDRAHSPLYWELIRSFGDQTGVPIVLNTSFNENEPIVRTPEEALRCFLRTKMDALALGNYLVRK